MSTRLKILTLLEENRGKSISGEYMAGKLDVSRNAVWKAIQELRRDGYQINATSSRGYSLADKNDILSVQGMLPFLHDTEQASKIVVHNIVKTTNTTAKELAIAGAKHGTVVIANSQTDGRGRYNRTFFSPADCGIYMSVVLHPAELPFSTPTLITAFAAVSVCNAIENRTGKSLTIKWVNDIFLADKKLCGILTEAVTDFESGAIQWIVVGIGINFSTVQSDFPSNLRDIAISLYANGNAEITRNCLIATIINEITCCNAEPSAMLAEYKRRLMMLDKKITVNSATESFAATALDIDDTGRLIVRCENGEIKNLSSGEIGILAL